MTGQRCTTRFLFRCGVSRGKAEAQAIVGEQFAGSGVTDDYGAYQSLFSVHQLCWAHLLRKAVNVPDLPIGCALATRPAIEYWTSG